MDVISAYREVGTYRGAATIYGTTHMIEAHRYSDYVVVELREVAAAADD